MRALTRKPHGQKAGPLRALGAQVVQADMDDRGSLEDAFANAYGVYVTGVPVPGKMEVEILPEALTVRTWLEKMRG